MDNDNYDVVVIGAGISGLLTALALSKGREISINSGKRGVHWGSVSFL